MKESYKRIFSAIIGTIILIIIVSKGNIYLNTGIFVISVIGLREFYLAVKIINFNPIDYIGYLSALLIYMSNFFIQIDVLFVLMFSLISTLTVYLFSKDKTLSDVGITLLGIFYVPFLFSYINLLEGSIYIWLIFIISFGTDTFAYLGGKYFGKRKLWPEVSPNKTIEGSISGVLGSLILTVLFAYFIKEESVHLLAFLAIIVSIFSQVGDLVASKIKRTTGIKDYGKIMPGHGGILDRFDSIILATPIIYYYMSYFFN